jgi:hypothetical protein
MDKMVWKWIMSMFSYENICTLIEVVLHGLIIFTLIRLFM